MDRGAGARAVSGGLALNANSDRTPIRRHRPKKLHGYFVVFSTIFTAIVVVGFSRSFFLPLAQGTFSRPPVVHVHGALFFGWTAFLVLQTALAATGKLKTHRKVGSVAAWLVIPMLLLGSLVAARDTVSDFRAGGGEERLAFFYGELADLAMFGLLAGGAMLLRHKPEFHKRWVILGALGLVGAAIGRIPEIRDYGFYIFAGLILSVALYDVASRRVLHPATMIGAAVLFGLNLTQSSIGNSDLWLKTAHQLLPV